MRDMTLSDERDLIDMPEWPDAPLGRRFVMSEANFERLGTFIQTSVGIKMPPQKKSMLELRLARRLRELSIDSFDDYCDLVFDDGDGAEIVSLLDHVTTNKTDFFRESEHFEILLGAAVPALRALDREVGVRRPLRVWSAGCSSGEEPYSIAMTLDYYSEHVEPLDFEVSASDLSSSMLAKAMLGVYAAERVEPVPVQMRANCLLRSKDAEAGLVRVAPHIRSRVRFARMNLCGPFEVDHRFDIVFCRNTLIYFERDQQIDVLRRISANIREGGYLFVGHSETLHGMGLPLDHVAPTVYRKSP